MGFQDNRDCRNIALRFQAKHDAGQGVYEKSTGKLIQCGVLGMDLLKCCSSYLCHLLNPSQTEGFLFFLLKIHFIADFNRLLLLSRLVKRILCSHL